MKKLFIMGCFTAAMLSTSCTTESIEEEETNIVNDDIRPPFPPPIENGDKDRDKDKVKG